MSEDWDFYFLLVDSEPASIYVDLGQTRLAPVTNQPHMGYVHVFMRQPRPDGLSSNEEFEALSALEDGLTESVAGNGATTYVGRNTSSGNRDFYFYTADPDRFAESVDKAMAAYPDYEFETGTRHDPQWEVYFGFLYPAADDLQRILNRRVTDSLAAHGDALSQPRLIDHMAYLPDASSTERLRAYLGAEGFSIDEPMREGDSVAMAFKRSDAPEAIDEVVIPIARLVRELGGDYDGWGCETVS